ncbi:MAG: hypothetical protein IPJ52_15765 [Rhodocyclaceae bacterium]|nr:hypothetical protein [Rhodocyclaceae bacterium]MBK7815624.1 hypothetical protein [Rhodocyclaceae bacterium]
MKLSRDGRAVLAATLWLLLPTGTTTVVASEQTAAASVEPALTKLESRAAQSKAGETAVIDEVLARVQRMNATVAELHTIIEAIPAQRCPQAPEPVVCPPAAIASPTVPPAIAPAPKPAAKTKVAEDSLADVPWQAIAAGLAVLALLGLLWRQRRQKRATNESIPVTQPSLPPSLTKPATAERKVSAGATPPAPAAAPLATPVGISSPPPPTVAETQPSPAAEVADNTGAADADLSLELAEVMLSMGLTDGAAQTLTDHIRAHPRQALFHWLKLLDIYRKSGMKNDFEKSAQEIQQHFNMAPPDWEPIDTDARPPGLESYAHIISRVQELWPRRSCAEYLNRLLEDNRGGTRTGFPQPVVEEILLLVALLKELGR